MAYRMDRCWKDTLNELRFEPLLRRLRADRNGKPALDSKHANLVWKPGDVVPTYSVPIKDLLVDVDATPAEDPDLAGHAILTFKAFENWREEEDIVRGHPRDPYHRVDVRKSTRRVRVEHDGVVIAESTRPTLLFETKLPIRIYIPREDTRMDLLRPSTTHTICAYKGDASYFSIASGDRVIADAVWTYEHPLADAPAIASLLSFYPDKVKVTLDE